AICATAALEMAIEIIKGIPCLASQEKDVHENFGKNLGGAIFYGLCAANIVPYTPLVGAIIFAGYSIVKCEEEDAYVTAKWIGNLLRPPLERFVLPLGKWLIKNIISPLAGKIAEVVTGIFNLISLSKSPIWFGVAALVVTIVAYKGFFAAPAVEGLGAGF
ncbi:MAG: hypothetical protein ACXU9U_03385, partial [Parachlamydiaceae bacterium]